MKTLFDRAFRFFERDASDVQRRQNVKCALVDDQAKSFNGSASETKVLAHHSCCSLNYVTLKLWESNRLNLLDTLDMVMDIILCTRYACLAIFRSGSKNEIG